MSLRPILTALVGAAGLLFHGLVGCDSSLSSPSVSSDPETPDPLVVNSVEPPGGRVELGPRFALRVTLSEPLDPSTPEGAARVHESSTGALVASTERIEAGGTPPQSVLVWQPEAGAMQSGKRYSLSLSDTIRSESGGTIDPEATDCGTNDCPRFPVEYETFQTVPELAGSTQVLVTSCSSADVSWSTTITTDNSPPDKISYRVILATGDSAIDPDDFSLETAPGVTRAFLEGLEPSTSYEVAVVAIDIVGNASSPTDAAAFATPPVDRCDPIPPDFAGLSELIVDATQPQVILARWEAGEDNETDREDLRYAIYVALEAGAQDFSVPFRISDPGAEEIAITGLSTNTTHHVVVRAVDSTGNEGSNRIELAATTPSSFSLDIRPILDQSPPFGGACTQPFCHEGTTNSGGLNLETYAGLVTVGGDTKSPPAVNPGNSEQSYLLWRTDESNPNFDRNQSRMPLGDDPLAAEQLVAIRRWIDQGALDN